MRDISELKRLRKLYTDAVDNFEKALEAHDSNPDDMAMADEVRRAEKLYLDAWHTYFAVLGIPEGR